MVQPLGAGIYCNPLDLIQRMILHFGVWEPDVSRVIEQNLAPGDVFVDVGANIGAATTLASRGGTLVASVEALPLEQILTPEERSRLRLIKMDVEGTEPPILRHLLEHLPTYPASMDIVVEATPDDDPEAWRDVFERMRAAGFTAWAIANEYELEWYLRWRRPSALQRVDIVPGRQQDLLFTRRSR